MSTTSWDVGPAGLATRTSPGFSVVRLLQLLEDPVDVLRVLQPAVQMEMQLGAGPQMQLFRELRPQKPRGARQPFERLRLLFFSPHDADAHLRVRQIGRDVDADHGDEADPRIAYIAGEKRSDRLPDQLTHALGPMTVSSHITDSSCWYRRCARRPRPPPAHPPRGARSQHAGGRCSPRPP